MNAELERKVYLLLHPYVWDGITFLQDVLWYEYRQKWERWQVQDALDNLVKDRRIERRKMEGGEIGYFTFKDKNKGDTQ